MLKKFYVLFFILFLIGVKLSAQVVDSLNFSLYYSSPKTYEIGGIDVIGIKYLDKNNLILLSGLQVGDEILVPGEKVTDAIHKLWRQGLFSDVKIIAGKIVDNKVYLQIHLTERPRLSDVNFYGVSKSEQEDITDKVLLLKGSQMTDNTINRAEKVIEKIFHDKGFLNTEVNIVQRDDTLLQNHVILDIQVDKKEKVKIQDIKIYGNIGLTAGQLEKSMKKTKARKLKNFFSSKKFLEEEFDNDKLNLIKKYNEHGYRDAYIVSDSVVPTHDNRVNIYLTVDEGNQYYFRDIKWLGNTKYNSEFLDFVLGIKKGDIYDQTLLEERISTDDDAVSNLYLNNGYLFFNVYPVETRVKNDSIDLEIRIEEGSQATIDRVIITGNTKTHEHVARREIRTKPGQLFSKDAIMRSYRELAQLGHFDPEQISPTPIPHPEEGTVDIKYDLVEKANDQVELSGGWGAGMFVGTIGLRFSNFSMRNFFNKEAWRPLPTGDGQTLSLRAQTNGTYYQSYSLSFVEPWLGGKKPNSLSLSFYHSRQTQGNSDYYYGGYGSAYGYSSYSSPYGYSSYNPYSYEITQRMNVTGLSIGLARRLSWPDDYFTIYNEISLQNYYLDNWKYFLFQNGHSNNLSFKTVFGRNSVDNPIFPRSGSNFSLSLEFTPPYSWFNDKDYAQLQEDDNLSEIYKWIEYHKWGFKGSVFTPISKNNKLILHAHFEYGFLGYYNENARSPFEGYNLGGDGMTGYSYYGMETIGLRGYENNSLTPEAGGNLYNKLTLELRYPITLQQSATIYVLGFMEAGNAWTNFQDFNPYNLKRSAGLGVRFFLPMFGQMGFDWGYGFDDVTGQPDAGGSQFHFIMGQSF